jgi:hypothetical protein
MLLNAVPYKLKGSSLAEVVTAMLIISLSMALTGMLFANVFGSSGRYLKQEAWFIVNEYVNATIQKKDVEPFETVLSKFSIEKTSTKAESINDLWIVTIDATTKEGKVLAMRKFMIEVPINDVKSSTNQ